MTADPRIRAVFFDIDGTLLSKNTPQISAATLAALFRLHQSGLPLFLATGRNQRDIAKLGILQQFPFDGMLLMTGSLCLYQNQVFYDRPLPDADARALLREARRRQIPCDIATAGNLYLSDINERVRRCYEFIHTELPEVLADPLALKTPVYQISPYCRPEEAQALAAFAPDCRMTSWYGESYDIFSNEAGKRAGILAASRLLNIPAEDMLAFGDAENDADMLEAVGHGIAMANADPALKQKAEFVCGGVDEDGILDGLRQYHLI